jgi:hypothetical protein
MEIKPSWLLEGLLFNISNLHFNFKVNTIHIVAPHYFKPADLEQLAQGDKKMPKTIGVSGGTPTPS